MELFSNLVQAFILLCSSMLGNCEVIMQWNKCPSQSKALRILYQISVNECLKQCNIRTRCQLVCYRSGLHTCEIHETRDEISNCNRCMSVFREDIPADQFGAACDCEDGQTCNMVTGACEYTECKKKTNISQYFYGNVVNVGAKMRVRCKISGHSSDITCANTGNWRGRPNCRNACPLSGALFTVTEEFRVRICSQAVTQPEARDNCSAIGGVLLKLNHFYKLHAVRNVLRYCSGFRHTGYWVDGYSENPTDLTTWKFSDGTPMRTDIGVYWSSVPLGVKTHCTRMRQATDYLLTARGCDLNFHYICEMI